MGCTVWKVLYDCVKVFFLFSPPSLAHDIFHLYNVRIFIPTVCLQMVKLERFRKQRQQPAESEVADEVKVRC